MELIRALTALYHFNLALLANFLYGYPARKLKVIAVTGTSGKTTTSHLIYSILKKAGKKVALISSVNIIVGGREQQTDLHVTTPNALNMQKILSQAVKCGDDYIVIEASSHGIAQFRMLGTNVYLAILTNIAHEHLDWHKTFASYAETKLSLIKKANIAIVNREDQSYQMFLKSKKVKAKIFTYALKDQKADFHYGDFSFKLKLPGDYNKQNALAAAATAYVLGINKNVIKKALLTFEGVKGRFDEVKNKRGFKIIVDFAHKPNALEAFLKTLKKTPHNRIIAVFGSAGLRDVEKRPMLGEIAAKYADISIITAEDPRTEDVNKIIDQIAEGFLKQGVREYKNNQKEKKFFVRIPDRAEAIDYAINKVGQKGDIIALLGKSHERSMCYGKKEYPWNEYEVIYRALAKE